MFLSYNPAPMALASGTHLGPYEDRRLDERPSTGTETSADSTAH